MVIFIVFLSAITIGGYIAPIISVVTGYTAPIGGYSVPIGYHDQWLIVIVLLCVVILFLSVVTGYTAPIGG